MPESLFDGRPRCPHCFAPVLTTSDTRGRVLVLDDDQPRPSGFTTGGPHRCPAPPTPPGEPQP